ncbi:phosphatidylinositol/phosphatidylglycerol transfer protein [Protomyces lactucae-debilis]|uniref:Phosphatidylglycerol/phosphatidylinositol transfer protein n=1 Tax=Protomyces lactucae-debilis TaxID=2754530 RepID=A0A1Y2FN82_PROLT|nr:phosphatidylinositol/phosphatidylglycerol transfer protein [Protomyces lactucae-debilis]ORY84804.1 phosphatidylinositol/phosphatidylglycerol transfer protein [Protomyces lactucae-debilis]
MRLSLVAALLPALSLAARTPRVTANELHTYIPGNSPIDYCQVPPPKDDLISIDRLELSPNPPERGQNLTIYAEGSIKEDIQQGAYVDIIVKYGLIRLLHTTLDLCEQTEKIDLACPIEAGPLALERVVELPKVIPPGKYSVQAQVFTEDGEQITCLSAHVQFTS